eukprot:1837523-Prymnesium_polylepis.1
MEEDVARQGVDDLPAPGCGAGLNFVFDDISSSIRGANETQISSHRTRPARVAKSHDRNGSGLLCSRIQFCPRHRVVRHMPFLLIEALPWRHADDPLRSRPR